MIKITASDTNMATVAASAEAGMPGTPGGNATAAADSPVLATEYELMLLDENNRPTPAFVALAALEIGFDILVGYAAYRLFKALKA